MNRLSRVHWLGRSSLAFMFAYHGLVPKLINMSPGEQLLLQAHGLNDSAWLIQGGGVAELILAALLLIPSLSWPLIVGGIALLALLIDVAIVQPSMLSDAFNPVTLNIAGMTLCAMTWMTRPEASRREA